MFLLFLLFLALKLTEIIDWSWWWVTAPLWGAFALLFVVCLSVAVATIVEGRMTPTQRALRDYGAALKRTRR